MPYPALEAIKKDLRAGLVFTLRHLTNVSAPGSTTFTTQDQFTAEVWVLNLTAFCPFKELKGTISPGQVTKPFPPITFHLADLPIGMAHQVGFVKGEITRDTSLMAAPLDEIIKITATSIADLSMVKISDVESETAVVRPLPVVITPHERVAA